MAVFPQKRGLPPTFGLARDARTERLTRVSEGSSPEVGHSHLSDCVSLEERFPNLKFLRESLSWPGPMCALSLSELLIHSAQMDSVNDGSDCEFGWSWQALAPSTRLTGERRHPGKTCG